MMSFDVLLGESVCPFLRVIFFLFFLSNKVICAL